MTTLLSLERSARHTGLIRSIINGALAFLLSLGIFLLLPLTQDIEFIEEPSLKVWPEVEVLRFEHLEPLEPLREPEQIEALPHLPDYVLPESPALTPAVHLEVSPLPVTLDTAVQAKLEQPTFEGLATKIQGLQAQSTIFKFEELSAAPRFLSVGDFTFPKELIRQGIKKGQVVLLIEIDRRGKAKVLGVESSSHRALEPVAISLVKSASFTIPTQQGQPVMTRGLWPVTLKAP